MKSTARVRRSRITPPTITLPRCSKLHLMKLPDPFDILRMKILQLCFVAMLEVVYMLSQRRARLFQEVEEEGVGYLTAGFHNDDENTIEVYFRPMYLGGPTFVNRSE
jgi:hypothetical protein